MLQVPSEYQWPIKKASMDHYVPYNLLASLLYHESGFNPKCRSVNSDGSVDRGIAQINDRAHPEVSDAQAYDPIFAINWAASYLSNLHKKYNDWWRVLLAYNGGDGAVRAFDAGHPYNNDYAQRIFATGQITQLAQHAHDAIVHLDNMADLDMCDDHKEYLHEVVQHIKGYMGW